MVRELEPGDPPAIGPYRLIGRLGQGGMGQVFLGMSPGRRPVAVKAIRAELAADPQFRARFGQEVAAARRVSGVFTAMVVDADSDGPVAWLATAYVPGPSLAEAVASHGPLPEESLLTLAAGLAESLNAIHNAGVVHRDLKPSNVLLAQDGPRVIDFGISRALEATTALTQTGLVVGSPGFMSPEQAMGGEVGPPSDIFSLGSVLAFAATGQGPFGTGPTATLLYRVVHEAPALDQVPPAVQPLIRRCLAKNPAQRPTANGLLAEVGALQPAGNWLPDSVIRAFTQDSGAAPQVPATRAELPWSGPATVVAGSAATAPAQHTQVAGGASAARSPTVSWGTPAPPSGGAHQQPAPGEDHRPRRRPRRPLVLLGAIGALAAASGATAFALTALTGHTHSPGHPRATAQTSTSPATPSGQATRGTSTPANASFPAGTSAPAGVSASPSSYTSGPSAAATSPAPSPAASPTVTVSVSPSASASPSGPASGSASGSPAASASGSASGSPGPSASVSPAPSAPVPASASATAPAATPGSTPR